MSKQPIITAIDLGTDKCVTLIATLEEETQDLRVIGISAVPSRGIRKSAIVDLEEVLNTLTESLDGAERMAGLSIKSAYVSLSGSHISSQNSKGVVAVATPNQEIVSQDVARVIEAARAVSLPNDRSIIHVIPRDFKVDTQTGIKDPVGMTGIRLESEAHIITGMTTALKNIEKCVHDAGLSVDGFVFSGLASSEVTTTETERELGVVVVDIGAGSTAICAFVEGSLELSTALPIGARHITQDLALGCRISLDAAEKIKTALSSQEHLIPKPRSGESKEELNKRRKIADKLDARALGIEEDVGELSKKSLIEGIMAPRIKEIFSLVGEQLHKNNLYQKVPAGLVITGGGAETILIDEVAKRTLRLPARVGIPQNIKGLTADIKKPSFATSIGLLAYGKRHGVSQTSSSSIDLSGILSSVPLSKILKKAGGLVKKIIP